MSHVFADRPDPNWVNYLTVLDDHPAMVSVDAGWIGALGYGDAETLLGLEILLRDKGEGEIVSRKELPALQELAEMLEAELPADFAYLVARSYGGGKMVLWIYTPHPDDVLALLSDLLEDSDYEFSSTEMQDPDWAHYSDVLFPDDIVWQNISNAGLLAQLAEHGDDGTVPRQITHRALFADRDSAGEFAARITEIGHEVEAFSDHDDDDLPVAVEFGRADAPASLNEVTGLLVQIAAEYAGRYDGWGTHVVTG